MKKLLLAVILSVLLIPTFVKADVYILDAYFNSKATVGVETEVIIPAPLNIEREFQIEYDPSIFKVEKKDVSLSYKEYTGPDLETGTNKLDVTINNGVIKVKYFMGGESGYLDVSKYLKVVFTPLKQINSTTIVVDGWGMQLRNPIKIQVLEKQCEECPKQEQCEKCEECNNTENKEETSNKEEIKNDVNDTKTNNNDLILYISLGVNALLLIILIIVLITKKKTVIINN